MISTRFIEEVPRIAVGDLGPLIDENEPDGDGVSVDVVVEIDGIAYRQTLALTSTELGRNGGKRWWVRCPRCGKRRMHLYLADGVSCRACLGVMYASQYRQ